MLNLMLTRRCNQRCVYCFARGAMDAGGVQDMDLETYRWALDLIRRGGGCEVRLLGGEPTLHPEFPAFTRMALDLGLNLLVFSNGRMPAAALDALQQAPVGRCHLVLNLWAHLDGKVPSVPRPTAGLADVLGRLGRRVVLGTTIWRLPSDLDGLLRVWDDARWELAPSIRLGLAHPRQGEPNLYLHPKQYPALGQVLGDLARDCTARGIALQFDCGFVACMLDEETRAALSENGASLLFQCRPVLDLDPSGRRLSYCFASGIALDPRRTDARDLAGLRRRLEEMTDAYRAIGVYRACSVCPQHQADRCDGGCLSHRLARLQVPAPVIPPEV